MYDTAVKLAREGIEAILDRAHIILQAEGLDHYAENDWSEVITRLRPALQHHFDYLESGDIVPWRTFCSQIIEARIHQGLDYTSTISMNRILLKATQEFFEETLLPLGTIDGLPSERIVRLLNSRLTGLDSVGSLTATATALKVSREINKLPTTV